MEETDNKLMKTFQSLEERQIQRTAPQMHPEAPEAQGKNGLRYPRVALALSILPGLGQIYNGETGKGLLFVGVSLANVCLISLLFATKPVLEAAVGLGGLFHAEPKINIQQALEIVHTGRSVTLVYLALILSYASYVAREAYDHAKETHKGKFFQRFYLGLPEATSGSYLFHFSIICALVMMVIFFISPVKPQHQATDIELVQEVPPPPPEPKKPDPPKAKKPDPPKLMPKKQEVVQPKQEPRREPPKPTPVAVAVPTDKPVADPVVQSNEPAPEASAPAGESSGSANGSPTGTGSDGGGSDGADVDFGSYLAEVQKRIKKAWFPPRGNESKSVTVKFKVNRDGSLGKIRLIASSGIPVVDQAATTAVKNASPFPALPAGSPEDIDIKFTFDYNVFNGKM